MSPQVTIRFIFLKCYIRCTTLSHLFCSATHNLTDTCTVAERQCIKSLSADMAPADLKRHHLFPSRSHPFLFIIVHTPPLPPPLFVYNFLGGVNMRLVSLLAILALASCVHAYWEPQRPVCSSVFVYLVSSFSILYILITSSRVHLCAYQY